MSRRKFDKEFKTTIIELLKNGKEVKTVCLEYDLDTSMVSRWRREFKSETGVLKMKRHLSISKKSGH